MQLAMRTLILRGSGFIDCGQFRAMLFPERRQQYIREEEMESSVFVPLVSCKFSGSCYDIVLLLACVIQVLWQLHCRFHRNELIIYKTVSL
jgi:hypothetical protein